jgi:hypothetical protein
LELQLLNKCVKLNYKGNRIFYVLLQVIPIKWQAVQLGIGLARLFGGKSEQLTRAEQLQERFKGIDVNSPEALREAARGIADLAPEQALQIASYASQLERDQMAPIVNLPIQVGTKPKYMLNPLTQQYEQVGEEPIFREVPFERLPEWFKIIRSSVLVRHG